MSSNIREAFPIRLKYYMQINGKKRNDLVRDLGFRYTTVRDWEKGLTVPRMDKVEKLAKYFNCNNSDLLEGNNGEPAEVDRLSNRKKEFIKRVSAMSDAQLDRLEQILALVESKE